jgi:iron complex transport system substrate-binding protein
MRWAWALLSLSACAQPPARGGGIVSVNPCADAMLVRLLPPGRIAAISHYSQDATATSIPVAVARRFRATAGTAEEVVALRPDLVLASTFTPPATRAAFARAGLRALYLDSPTTVAASRTQVMEVAAAVGAPERGGAIVGEIDRALATHAPPRRRPGPSRATGPRPAPGGRMGGGEPTALLFIAGELANGSGTLLDELMTRAGFVNAAARYGLRYTGSLPAELIVSRPPDVILTPEPDGRIAAMRRRLLPRTPIARFPRELINCGGPTIAPALRRLAAIRRGLA